MFESDRLEGWLTVFFLFAFASGTLAHLLPSVLPVTRVTTDGLLLVINGLLFFALWRRNVDARLLWWLVAAYGITFSLEAIGVATGAIFGDYTYGPTMWWQWLGVPFVIALNWAALTLACNDLAERLLDRFGHDGGEDVGQGEILGSTRTGATKSPEAVRENRSLGTATLAALLAGIFTALYDVAIEPVAIALDYWTWAAGDIPLQNYLAWAAIAFAISLPLQLLRIRYRSPLLLVYLLAQLFFFLVLNFAL
ncbi:carotenoid biosynthesis protein [Lewinella sp. W8]|uniref:carotenoid biosynthesis protein n=1 Tax=Lewinella sp. W8 TaxID=2528208 RepID=UPI0034CEC7DE